jgi:hypothetical protein
MILGLALLDSRGFHDSGGNLEIWSDTQEGPIKNGHLITGT